MSTTITGKLENLGTGSISSGSFVRFYLRGAAGNQPRVDGTAVIAPTLGNVYYFDFVPNASGIISGTLWSTRDSTGLLGGDIEAGGVTTACWYGLVIYLNGKAGPETPVHAKNGATLDITSVTPITTSPVITAPTGDSTYARLDAGNQPFTGAIQAPSVNTSVYVAPSAGMAGIQTAINNAPSGGREIQLSPGIYTGSVAIVPTNGIHIRCTNTGWGNTYDTAGCVIQPSSGNAIWAISGPGSGTVTNFKMTDVTLDLTADSSALGGLNWIHALYSEFYNVRVILPASGGMDGFRFDGTVTSYWGKCFGCTVVSIAPGAISNTHNAFHYTGAANSNWCYGCVALLVNNFVLIDGASSNVGIFGGGSDHFGGNCISVQGTARGNLAKGVRCEETFQAPTGAAVNIGATAVENTFEQIYVVGAPNAASVVTDASGGKNTINIVDTAGQYANIVFGNNTSNFNVGINKTPTTGIALDINGRLNMSGFYYQTANGLFRLDGNTHAGVEATVINCDSSDACYANVIGAGGFYFASPANVKWLGVTNAGITQIINTVGLYNGVNTAGQGVAPIYGATLQKAETGSADANVLTYTPAAVAGNYEACFSASVSSATSGVIAWTLSYKNSNSVAETNLAMPLFQQGTAAPNTTFTTSAAGEYQGCWRFDIDNSATNIVAKWVGGGTTAAKVSAAIQRIQ